MIANADFGFLVSECGGGYDWSINSGENRLTAWHNDPVMIGPVRCSIRDEQTADIWSPTPCPAAPAPYLIRHGAGYSNPEHDSHGLKQYTHMFVAPDEAVKIIHLRLENMESTAARTGTYYADGVGRESEPSAVTFRAGV